MNEQVRVAEGVHGEIVVMGVWCPSCKQETQPGSDGRCHWCKRHVLDEDQLNVRDLLRQIRGEETGLSDGVATGVHVVLPDEPHEPAQRLLETLGATYEVMPEPTPIRPEVNKVQTVTWDRQAIVEAFQRWTAETGEPPSSTQWQKSNPGYPTYNTVRAHFDSWADLVAAAEADTAEPASEPAHESSQNGSVASLPVFPPPESETDDDDDDDDDRPAETLAVLGLQAEQLLGDLVEARAHVRELEQQLNPVLGRIRDRTAALETELAA